jgi:hypothetical protein
MPLPLSAPRSTVIAGLEWLSDRIPYPEPTIRFSLDTRTPIALQFPRYQPTGNSIPHDVIRADDRRAAAALRNIYHLRSA